MSQNRKSWSKSICSVCASFPPMELHRQSPSAPKTALVVALDETTQLFPDTAVQRGIKIPSDTLLQSCKRSCACSQCLSPCYSSLLVNSCQRWKITLSSSLLSVLPSFSPWTAQPPSSSFILEFQGREGALLGRGGEHLQPSFSFLPGQRLLNVLGPKCREQSNFCGYPKKQLQCQLTLILFGTNMCGWDLLELQEILPLTRLQLLGTFHCASVGIVRAIPGTCRATCQCSWQRWWGRICWCNRISVSSGPVGPCVADGKLLAFCDSPRQLLTVLQRGRGEEQGPKMQRRRR